MVKFHYRIQEDRDRGYKEEGINDFLLEMLDGCGLLPVFVFKCWVFLFYFSEI